MSDKGAKEQIPPTWLVRVVASVTLVAGVALVILSIVYFKALGPLPAIGALLAGIAITSGSVASLWTGDPEWILLNLIATW